MLKRATENRERKTAESTPGTATSGGRAQEAEARNRVNTGGTGKKNPNRIRVGISHYGGAGGNPFAMKPQKPLRALHGAQIREAQNMKQFMFCVPTHPASVI